VNGNLAGVLIPIVATVAIIGMVTLTGGRSVNEIVPLLDPNDSANTTCLDEPVRPIGGTSVSGRAWLCLSRGGAQARVDLEQLSGQMTYTAWLVSVDRPDLCESSPCADADLAQERISKVFERIDGTVPDVAHRASLIRSFRELHPVTGAQVQILVFQLGDLAQLDTADRARMLVQWPLTGVGRGPSAEEVRRTARPLVGRAVIKLRETPQASDRSRDGDGSSPAGTGST
jgi:hypothetical protein